MPAGPKMSLPSERFFMGLDRGPGFVAMLRQGLPFRVEDANRDRQP
jgi:hypothetical protein